jgi:SAM-dependent methyltransferase
MDLPVDSASFRFRTNRIEYMLEHFSHYLFGEVLDVGCDKGILRNLLPKKSVYLGIDVAGEPDIHVDLESVDRLPFEDNRFDVVVCTDVLEHLDNLHQIFAELIRVSRQYLIISLPNSWAVARRAIARGRGEICHYGLPVQPPKDRHKWFFNLSDAKSFLEEQAHLLSYTIVEMRATEKPRPFILNCLLRLLSGSKERYLNRFAHTLWAVLEKSHSIDKVAGRPKGGDSNNNKVLN